MRRCTLVVGWFTMLCRIGRMGPASVTAYLDPRVPATVECNYAGWPSSDGCRCAQGFRGPRCEQLDLAPAATSMALFRPTQSSWGGSVATDPTDGRHHMFFADMLDHCGLNSWECNSAVSHAVAPAASPEGPYTVADTAIVPAFGHNPTVHVHNGTWYVYHIGSGVPHDGKEPLHCSNGSTGTAQCGGSSEPFDSYVDRMLMANRDSDPDPGLPNVVSASSPDGPWTAHPGDSAWALNNPALHIFPNGTTLAMYKVGCNSTVSPDPKTFCRQFALGVAAHPLGPFKFLSRLELFGEDPYFWLSPPEGGGGFHVVFQGGSYTKALPQWSGHFHVGCSPDGVSGWQIAGPNTSGFPNTIPLTNGSVIPYLRRERHQLLFNAATGFPSHMFNGVTGGPAAPKTDQTLTAVQPFAGPHIT